MVKVFIESPYAATSMRGRATNVRYLRSCLRDSLFRGEAPFASHGLYTLEGVLEDSLPVERTVGIDAGEAWRAVSDLVAVYVDRGYSPDMRAGVARSKAIGMRIVERRLGESDVVIFTGAYREKGP